MKLWDVSFSSQLLFEVNSAIGESYPLGMHLHGWAAAFATSAVACILLEEKFSFVLMSVDSGLFR